MGIIFEYKCKICEKYSTKEYVSRYSARKHITCKYCGNTAYKIISAPKVHFKGAGFYSTDNRKAESETK